MGAHAWVSLPARNAFDLLLTGVCCCAWDGCGLCGGTRPLAEAQVSVS